VRVDGRPIGEAEKRDNADASGPMTRRLRALYKALEAEEAQGRAP
jgi:branched-chain amino acid aminotransferase